MPVAKPALGKTLDVFLYKETTYGVVPTANFIKTPVYTFGLRASRPLENDQILGIARDNGRDATPPAPGLTSHNGASDIPLDLNHIGWWFCLAFGAPTTTEDDGVFTHVWESGSANLPSWAMVQQLPLASSTEYRRHIGVVLRSMRFGLGQEAGYRKMSVELGGRNESRPGSAGPGTVPAMLSRVPFPAAKGLLKRGGVAVANLLSFEGTYDAAMEEERLVDESDQVSSWGPGENEASFAGNMRLRYLDDTFDDLGEAQTAQAIDIVYQTSADLSLTIALPSVTFERPGLAINGPGRIEQQVGFRAAQTDSAPMMTLTLINEISSYAAGA